MRRLKQFLYGIFYLVVLAGLGSGVYFWYVRPGLASCVNQKKDYNEAGVDCGGVCSRTCLPDLQPVAAGDAAVLPLNASSTETSIFAEIRNPNQDFGAEVAYSLDLVSGAGETMETKTGSFLLAPGDIRYLAFPDIRTAAALASAKLSLGNTRWIPGRVVRRLDLAVNVLGADVKDGVVSVQGTLVNNDSATAEEAELLGLFFDGSGRPLGVSKTVLENVGSKQSRSFVILHPELPGLDTGKIRVVPSAYFVQQ